MKKLLVFLVAAFVFVMTAASQAAADDHNNAIVTESGPLKGITTGPVNEYLGIPYAAPPLGALRWLPPKPFGKWHGVFQATQFGSECQQTLFFGRPHSARIVSSLMYMRQSTRSIEARVRATTVCR